MAENESDAFGASIVFEPGEEYYRDKDGFKTFYQDESADGKTYIELQKLVGCDVVDEPAANDGLFSSFSKKSIAGQITEFFDLNPTTFDALANSPEIMKAIAENGGKVSEFIEKYQQYKKESNMEKEFSAEDVEFTAEKHEESTEITAEPAEEVEELSAEVEEQEPVKEDKTFSVDMLKRLKVALGAEIAAEAIENGWSEVHAYSVKIKELEAENEELKKQLSEAIKKTSVGGQFVSASTPKTKKSIFKNNR